MYLNEAKAYSETNCLQRQYSEETLNECASKIQWLAEGVDSVLHCGSGDILFGYAFPLLPKNFTRLVGIDYAVKNYRHPELSFKRADIYTDVVNKSLNRFGQFDHITTSCSLLCVIDQELVFKNIFDLLASHGDTLITIRQSHKLYIVMMALNQWKDYRQQILSMSPYFDVAYPVEMLKQRLEKTGFGDIHVESKECMIRYHKQAFFDPIGAIAPSLCRLPESHRREFLTIYEQKVMQMSQNNHHITAPYRMLIAYARKESNRNTNNIDINHTQTHRVPLTIDEVRMYNAKRYKATNCMQRKDALDTITEYQSFFQWSPEGNDYLLEIGIGCGDITYDYILPIIPPKTRIVATDKSQEMLDYASLHFPDSRISFDKLDIESENDGNELLQKYGQFQHIVSFFALHWALQQYRVMQNIFNLLQPDGEVLVTLIQTHPLYQQYADICEMLKWSPHIPDVLKFIPPNFREEHPEKELYRRMEQAGFVDINVVLKERIFHFDSQVFVDSIIAVAPFLDKLSESLKQEFLDSYINKVMTMNLPAPYESNGERNDGKTLISFRMLVAHAKKPCTNV